MRNKWTKICKALRIDLDTRKDSINISHYYYHCHCCWVLPGCGVYWGHGLGTIGERTIYLFQIKYMLSNSFNQPLSSTFHMHESQRWLWHYPCLQSSEPSKADRCVHRKWEYHKCGECWRRSLHKGLLRHKEQYVHPGVRKVSREDKEGYAEQTRERHSVWIHFDKPTKLEKVPCQKDA